MKNTELVGSFKKMINEYKNCQIKIEKKDASYFALVDLYGVGFNGNLSIILEKINGKTIEEVNMKAQNFIDGYYEGILGSDYDKLSNKEILELKANTLKMLANINHEKLGTFEKN